MIYMDAGPTSFTGPSGTDLNAPWLDPSDGLYRVITDRPTGGGVTGGMMLFRSSNLMDWIPEPRPNGTLPGTLHEYKWTRCVTLPSQCGFGPYPRDPGMFKIAGSEVYAIYGMQKTCSDSGREFYALGRWNSKTHSFSLLDAKSDYANNVWDGGEGYASMALEDPTGGGRTIWSTTLIEGDRDPSDPHSGFINGWCAARGWFGTLALPRLVVLNNITLATTATGQQQRAVFISTPPLPELATLRSTIDPLHRPELPLAPRSFITLALRGRSLEINATFRNLLSRDSAAGEGTPSTSSFDVGLDVLRSEDGTETTRVGIRSGELLPGVWLWDEVNANVLERNVSGGVDACRALCAQHSPACEAWSYSNNALCELKSVADSCIQQASVDAPCFLPYPRNGTTSGYAATNARGLRYASLYIERSASSANATYGKHNFAAKLLLLPGENDINLHVFVDRSVVEAFAQGGRAAVTARVYPTVSSDNVALFSHASPTGAVASVDGWRMESALVNATEFHSQSPL